MMQEFLQPISDDFGLFLQELSPARLGKQIKLHTQGNFPDLQDVKLAIITVNEFRGGDWDEIGLDFNHFRKNLYQLYPGNWTSVIADLGTLQPGNELEDTYFALKQICEELYKKNIVPVVVGGSQDLTYAMYRAYDRLEQMVNLVAIDSKIDMVQEISNPSENYLTKIILEEPVNLQNLSNLGYQTYFNSQEEIDLIEKMYFEAYRVGEISNDLALAEPVLRDADLVSMDISAIKSADLGYYSQFNPNGFDGREICAISRYAGLSDKVSAFGFFNIDNKSERSLLLSQIIWYFFEGYNYRINEYPYISKESYFKYIVPMEEQDLVFYKSDVSERWWIEIEYEVSKDTVRKSLFPCSYQDYERSLQHQIPERWWKAMKKIYL